ncbi:MAG: hypothetical protein K2J49_02100, partial [Muribaculaceae bacterium]|nr:hypothetical protein [Muribaculaceae bacterium]
QIFSCFETGKTEVALRDAADGSIIYKHLGASENDMGRALVADIDPASPGCELWWYRSKVHTISGEEAGDYPGSTNMAIWFDGGLNRQILDGDKLDNYKQGRVFTIYRYDMSYINGSKKNPSFFGDILGDWREEIIVPDATKVKDLKIFSTWIPTDHRFPWLMTDHVYEMSALNQNIGYNQPTQLGYYLGSDLESDEEAWKAGGYMDDSSAVDSVISESGQETAPSDGILYNLSGQRVSNPVPGIYILNGRKVIIR